MSDHPRLRLSEIGWDVGNKSILGHVDLTLGTGECLAVVGPNGAGKTTLLRIAAGLLVPTRGELLWERTSYRDLSRRALARRIAYVPQSRPLQVPLTVEELVLLGRYPYLSPFRLAPRASDFTVTAEAMRVAGIEPLRSRSLESLSGGERQTAYIAAALAQEAEVLILDEPTTHLDPHHQREVAALVLRLNRDERLSVLLATHDLNLAALVADRIVALKHGSIVEVGPPGRVFQPEVLERIFDAPFTVVRPGERPTTLLEIEP